MSDTALALRQIKYENRSFWRNPAAAFFTFVFPLMFMVIFNLIFGSSKYSPYGPGGTVSDFYTPALMAFSIITACYTNIAMGVVFARIAVSVMVAAILVVVIGAFGRLFYHVHLPHVRTLAALLVSLAVGAATFCAIGLAMTGFVPNFDAAHAVVNATIFPLLFISDVFIPIQKPGPLTTVASIFPVQHLSHAVRLAYNPLTIGSAFHWQDLAIMVAWGAAAIVFALRKFRWEPREQS